MTDQDNSTVADALVDRYLAVWNDADPSSRRARIDDVWSVDGRYVDPLGTSSGRAEFDELVAGAQQQFAGLTFERGPVFDAHHNVVRFTWNLVGATRGEPIAVGFDVAEIDDKGRIQRISGFLDSMPA